MMKQYPMTLSENYQNENLNEDRITEKHISIQTGFRKAADTGKKSDSSRVVFIYQDLCTSSPFGMETSGRNNDKELQGNEPQSQTYFPQTETSPKSLVPNNQ